MAGKDWSGIQKRYPGKWVALKKDEVTVVAAGQDLLRVAKLAKKRGYPHPLFTRMPENLLPRFGSAFRV